MNRVKKEIHKGQSITFDIKLDNDKEITCLNKTYADIEDISCNLKLNTATDADDLYCESLQSRGEITLTQADHKYSVTFTQEQTKDLEKGNYAIVLAVKLNGLAYMVELNIGNSQIRVRPDRQRS